MNNRKSANLFLFIVVLGGRTKSGHIEQHDVRWVIGSKIEDTFSQLRNEWFGNPHGLHIDSYIKIKYIEGHHIIVKEQNICVGDNKINKVNSNFIVNKSLWFVNLGGYDPGSLFEKHRCGLFVAKTSLEAKKKALSSWKSEYKQVHKDDIGTIKDQYLIDDCHEIRKISKWIIQLNKDSQERHQEFVPDWYGYKRIDLKYISSQSIF